MRKHYLWSVVCGAALAWPAVAAAEDASSGVDASVQRSPQGLSVDVDVNRDREAPETTVEGQHRQIEEKARDGLSGELRVRSQSDRDLAAGAIHDQRDFLRASKLMDMEVRNHQNEELGEIDGMLVDAKTGQIRYLALSYGGTAGIGDKLFAVPLSAFTFTTKTDDAGEHFARLDTAKQDLEKSAGFDKDNWPSQPDALWMTHARHDAGDALHPKNLAVEPKTPVGGDTAGTAENWIYRADDLIGADVRNEAHDDLGDVKDLMIDLNSGRIEYAALSFGGFLGIGDKLFAVPWSAFKLQREKDDRSDLWLVLDVPEERLRSAPGFNQDHWPNFADNSFRQEIDTFYQGNAVRAAERPSGAEQR